MGIGKYFISACDTGLRRLVGIMLLGNGFPVVGSLMVIGLSVVVVVCEKSPAAAVIPCYADNERDVMRLIERALKDAGLTIEPDAREELMGLLGADRLASRAELDKLALYAQGKGRIGLADVQAIIADASALVLDDAIDAAAAGEREAVLVALRKARADFYPRACAGIGGRIVTRQSLLQNVWY